MYVSFVAKYLQSLTVLLTIHLGGRVLEILAACPVGADQVRAFLVLVGLLHDLLVDAVMLPGGLWQHPSNLGAEKGWTACYPSIHRPTGALLQLSCLPNTRAFLYWPHVFNGWFTWLQNQVKKLKHESATSQPALCNGSEA